MEKTNSWERVKIVSEVCLTMNIVEEALVSPKEKKELEKRVKNEQEGKEEALADFLDRICDFLGRGNVTITGHYNNIELIDD